MGRPPVKSVEDKTRIVLAVLRGEVSITSAARREGVSQTSIAKWRDAFVEAGQAAIAAGADVCVVSVAPSGKPVFAKPRDGGHDATEFWVRVGNATKQLHGDDMLEYQSRHWG